MSDAGQKTSEDVNERATGGEEESVALDTVFRLLASERRRQVISYLGGSPGGVSLDELADGIASTAEGSAETVSDDRRRLLRAELHHVHLPMLAEAGVLDYDRRHELVGVTTWPQPLADYLPGAERRDEPDGGGRP